MLYNTLKQALTNALQSSSMKKIFILYGALAAFVVALIIWRATNFDFRLPFTSQASAQINEQEMNLIVAKTEEDRVIGLTKRRSLSEDTGMLFVFEEKGTYDFWMKKMNFPIDIIFIDDNKVVDIKKNAQPVSEDETNPPIYSPNSPVNYVLEVKAGVADTYKITEGTTITFENLE